MLDFYDMTKPMSALNLTQMMPPSTSPSVIIDRSNSPTKLSGSVSSSNSRLARFQKVGQRSRSLAGRSYSQPRGISPAFSNMEERIKSPSMELPSQSAKLAVERLVPNGGHVTTQESRERTNEMYESPSNFTDELRHDTLSANHQDDASVAGSDFSESTNVPRRNLRVHDVAALILNKMVGTGIFTTPGLVLALTKDKPTSIALWIIGGIHAMLWYFDPI